MGVVVFKCAVVTECELMIVGGWEGVFGRGFNPLIGLKRLN
jgi:hypothetical protein